MVCFVNVQSADSIFDSIFPRFNLEWKARTFSVFNTSSLTTATAPATRHYRLRFDLFGPQPERQKIGAKRPEHRS
jgi:hypothetical protein